MKLFLNNFIPFLEDITQGVDVLGLNLCSELRTPENKTVRNTVAFDILYRIHTNLKTILLLFKEMQSSEETQYSLPINMSMRCIINDAMLTLYLLLQPNDDILEQEVLVNDLKHIKFIHDTMPIHLDMATKLFPNDVAPPLQEYMDRHHEPFKNYLLSDTGAPWEIKKPKDIRDTAHNNNTGEINTKKIREYVASVNESKHKLLIDNLYKVFKYFSQTEHYSMVGRLYSRKMLKTDIENYKETSIYTGETLKIMVNNLPIVDKDVKELIHSLKLYF